MIEEKLKEEFEKEWQKDWEPQREIYYSPANKEGYLKDGNLIADWWLSKFQNLHKQILEEDIKTMEGMQMKKGWMPLGFGEDPYNKTLSRLIDSKREALEALNKLKD